jgi:Na+-translocating ferredoxin:NAD+ oxidoreductase RnfC subunit
MMGRLTRDPDEPVTKTTGGLIVLPGNHPLITRLERPKSAMHQIGKSACDQCSYCTELCPRYLLGYAIEPHKVMRSLVFSMSGSEFWNRFGMLCCECGLCTLYACPEDLYPREACQVSKQVAQEKDIRWTPDLAAETPGMQIEVKAHPMYESRHIPLKQLVGRLGLSAYDVPAPLSEVFLTPSRVRIPLKQHAGAPAQPSVLVGDRVEAGQVVADVSEGDLGAAIHASIAGTVCQIDPEIVIEA